MKIETIETEKQGFIPLSGNPARVVENSATSNFNYRAVNEHLCCDLNGEAVILSLKTGKYYGLNAVGARIWELIQFPVCASAIEDAILAEYEVEGDLCRREVAAFLSKMAAEGLIEIDRDPNDSAY